MSEGTFTKIDFKPGIVKDITDYSATGYYVSCDKVRERDGKMEKIGGWISELVSQYDNPSDKKFTGVARDIHTWADLEGKKYLAVGTHKKLELFYNGQIYDITPIVASVSVNNVITTSLGSTKVLISVAAHAREVGDYIVVSNQTTSVGNILLNGDYEVVSVPNLDSLIVSVPVTANANANGGGGVQINYLLESGQADNTLNNGYGGSTYGTPGVSVSAGWSEPRSGTGVVPMRLWSLDNRGEDLIANPRGYSIYRWEASAGPTQRAQRIVNAPSICNFVQVAQPIPYIVAYGTQDITGTFNPLLVRWSDGTDFEAWTPAYNNTAGDQPLGNGVEIIGVEQTKREVIIGTRAGAVYSQKYDGAPFIFGFDPVANNADLISPQAISDINGIVEWMGTGSFYRYDGSVKKLETPLDKAIFDQTFDTAINIAQKDKTFNAINTEFSESTWYYPSKMSTEIDRYVTHNYLSDTWYYGSLNRTVWEDRGIFEKPYAVAPDGTLYIHEMGKNNDASPMKAFIESAVFTLSDGNEVMFADRMIPDFRTAEGKSMNVTISTKKFINDTFVDKGPYAITSAVPQIHFRARGRFAKIRYSTSVTDGSFEVGSPLFAVKPDGRR